MRKRRKIKRGYLKSKLYVVFLVGVIASAGISGSYASCFGSLNATSFGSGDSFCSDKVGIYAVTTADPGPNYLQSGGSMIPVETPIDGTSDPQAGPGCNAEGKNVASTNIYNMGDVRCSRRIDSVCTRFYDGVEVVVDNAYPWYASGIEVIIANCGGCLPANLICSNFKWEDDPDGLSAFLVVDYWEITHGSDVFSGSTFCELKNKLEDITLNACDYLTINIGFYFKQDLGDGTVMPQDASLKFNWSMCWKQSKPSCDDWLSPGGGFNLYDIFIKLKNLFDF